MGTEDTFSFRIIVKEKVQANTELSEMAQNILLMDIWYSISLYLCIQSMKWAILYDLNKESDYAEFYLQTGN